MKSFDTFQPTEIRFGIKRLSELGEVVARHGKRCLMVTMPIKDHLAKVYERAKHSLLHENVKVEHFDGVLPNPTTEIVSAGANMAKDYKADVILGIGGGSSMDTAKAIAVETVHSNTSWDYLYFRETQPTEKTLPVIAVSTTSGTGSQVTQVAVITKTDEKTKSAIFNPRIFPKACIIDPELMVTVPRHVTASTGFDVFCHAFESYLHPHASPYTNLLALESIRLVLSNLPAAAEDGSNLIARKKMAWADTLAGLCIANAGVTLPHGIGMTIGGQCPHVMHGEALAVIYPEFMPFTFPSAPHRFATLGRILNPDLKQESDEVAAKESCKEVENFLKRIGMWMDLKGLNVTEEDIVAIADHSRVLPDYKNNPRIASRDEILEMLTNSITR